MKDDGIELILVGAIVPKARPRVTRSGHAYLPSSYAHWKRAAIAQLTGQWRGGPIDQPVAIGIILTGRHSRRGDCDNISGAVLDALVQSQILIDDNLIHVPQLGVRLEYGNQPPIATVKLIKMPTKNSGQKNILERLMSV